MVLLILALMLPLAPADAQLLKPAPVPRAGIDYELLLEPQPAYAKKSKREIAEVFSYGCIHCANFQPLVDEWIAKRMPGSARWVYVPAAFGASWDNFARAFFAAEILDVRKQTHQAAFRGVFEQRKVPGGKLEEIADMYAGFGVDRKRFLATMESEAVTGKLAKAREFAVRTGIQGTPTLILEGKYRINVTSDRGFAGALATLDYLLAGPRSVAPPVKPD